MFSFLFALFFPQTNPADFIVNSDDFQSNDIRLIARNKHNKTQIIFMIFTALFYLIHTLRAYIPTTNSRNLKKFQNKS